MATLLWANVLYNESFAGVLKQEPGGRSSFVYDADYVSTGLPPISYSMPIRPESYIFQTELPPFFDNLVAEGWLEKAQVRLLAKRIASRFELLLAFGQDCAGAVSVIDPLAVPISTKFINVDDQLEMALLTSRASLSGVQPKMAIIERAGKFYPTSMGMVSSHIAKFPSAGHFDIVANEYLSTLAFKKLVGADQVVDMQINYVEGISEPALIIKRFDRSAGHRVHFEEFNQLLGNQSIDKYDGSYKDLADFMRNTPICLPSEIYNLYVRILAGILIGNSDMHLKNFAMFHTVDGLRLTPSYDQVAAAIYDYKQMALSIRGTSNLILNDLKPKNIIGLGEEFGLSISAINMAAESLGKKIDMAKQVIIESSIGSNLLKQKIIELMEKRWNGTFALIGQASLKKP